MKFRWPVTFKEADEKRALKKPGEQKLWGTQAFEAPPTTDMPYTNPDDLVGKHGLTIFSKMLREDEMLNSASCYLLLATVSPGFEIVAGEEDNESERAAEFQRENFEQMRGTTTQLLLNVLDAGPRGFSVLEPEWKEQETEGEWLGKQFYKQIFAKNPGYIEFKVDSYGRVVDDGVWQLNYSGSDTGLYTKVDLKDVFYWAFWPRDDNPYGSPLLRPAYPYYFAKAFGLKQWWKFLERFGHPLILGRVDEETGDEDVSRMEAMLKKLWVNLVSVLKADPGTIDVDLKQPDYKSTDQYERMIAVCNRCEARSMLLPSMVMEHDGATGSLALAREHGSEGQFMWMINYFAEGAETVMNEQVIPLSHVHNFGEKVPQPKFKIKEHVKEDLKLRAEIYGSLSLIGVPYSLEAIRKEFSIPEPSKDDTIVGGRPAGGGPLDEALLPYPKPKPTEVPQVPGVPPGAPPEKVEKAKKEFTEAVFDLARGWRPGSRVYSFGQGAPSQGRPLRDIERHIDFAIINAEEDAAVESSAENFGVIFEDMAQQLETAAGKGNGDQR